MTFCKTERKRYYKIIFSFLIMFSSFITVLLLFAAADRSPDRARELRRLVHALPEAHYETLKYLIQHLRRVVEHSAFNKMEARNLAIVFGPTLVRAASDDMLTMVNDMSSQCRIIESFLTHVSIIYPPYIIFSYVLLYLKQATTMSTAT